MTTVNRLNVVLNHLHGVPQYSGKSTSSSKYFYTLDNDVLTAEQRAFYEENGYLVVRNLVDHKLLDECINRFVGICNGEITRGEIVIMKEKSLINTAMRGENVVNKIQDIFHDDVFIKYMTHPKILKYVACFTGVDITGFNSMLINKPPTNANAAAIHPLHQDLYYFPIRPAERIVACWTAMEKVTLDNGCLFVVPASHKGPLYTHEYPNDKVNFMYYEAKGCASGRRVYLEMEKGDTVFFHPLLCHGSDRNETKGFRKAIACHYASSNCHYIERDASHTNVVNEMQKAGRMRGLKATDVELFRLRQSLIQGRPGLLNQL